MNLINEKYEKIENMGSKYYFYYDFKEQDFFISKEIAWYELCTDVYTLKIGNNTVDVPFNYNIVIGDFDGGLDIIKPTEILGRDFEAFVFNRTLEEGSWRLEEMKVVGMKEDVKLIYPINTKGGAYPICLGENKSIIISHVDVYTHLKRMDFSDII